MLILADLGHDDPKHWPSEAATAADQSDDCGALAFGGSNSDRPIGGVWGAEPPATVEGRLRAAEQDTHKPFHTNTVTPLCTPHMHTASKACAWRLFCLG